jgi:hypothetical protein
MFQINIPFLWFGPFVVFFKCIFKKNYGYLSFFQVNLGIYVQDRSTELSVLVDRSVGGSSLVDGQIELMLHRLNQLLALISIFFSLVAIFLNYRKIMNE